MSLSYHFSFTAPAGLSASTLESFLKAVERLAKSLGFTPTTVLNIVFDNKVRRDFSRRLGGSIYVESEKLQGVVLPSPDDATNHNQHTGGCRLVPRKAVVLVVTNERGSEVCFGFMKYPAVIRDINGQPIVESGTGDDWVYRDFADTPDIRFRQIVMMFADAGYLKEQRDEYAPAVDPAAH